MEDRLLEFDLGQVKKNIQRQNYSWYIDGKNHDYVSNELVKVTQSEVDAYTQNASDCISLFEQGLDYVIENNLFYRLGIDSKLIPLIEYDRYHKIPMICGRLDFAGGVDEIETKLLEFNADTCTILPESVLFQKWMMQETSHNSQFNTILLDIAHQFEKLRHQFPEYEPGLLLISLGHPDDELNLKIYEQACKQAGFETKIARLEDVVFAEEGVFLESDGQYQHFPFVHKLVPWEFIMKEEPELLKILTNLVINELVIITNPAYSLVYQSKHLLSILYSLFPNQDLLLPTYNRVTPLMNKPHVKKAGFGRMGENIEIVDKRGSTIHRTRGDYGSQSKVYQAYAQMITDDDGDIYQPGVFVCGNKVSGLSFRRTNQAIIDDDSEFLGHVIA